MFKKSILHYLRRLSTPRRPKTLKSHRHKKTPSLPPNPNNRCPTDVQVGTRTLSPQREEILSSFNDELREN